MEYSKQQRESILKKDDVSQRFSESARAAREEGVGGSNAPAALRWKKLAPTIAKKKKSKEYIKKIVYAKFVL